MLKLHKQIMQKLHLQHFTIKTALPIELLENFEQTQHNSLVNLLDRVKIYLTTR